MIFIIYCKIHFTTCQCPFPGLCIYLLTTPTAYKMSDLVHIIAYIKLPIVFEYEIFDINCRSILVFRGKDALSLKWEASRGTFFKYSSEIDKVCPFFNSWIFPFQVSFFLYLNLSFQILCSTMLSTCWLFSYSLKLSAYHLRTIRGRWKIYFVVCVNTHNDQNFFVYTFVLP